jgi:hypothetical protein
VLPAVRPGRVTPALRRDHHVGRVARKTAAGPTHSAGIAAWSRVASVQTELLFVRGIRARAVFGHTMTPAFVDAGTGPPT